MNEQDLLQDDSRLAATTSEGASDQTRVALSSSEGHVGSEWLGDASADNRIGEGSILSRRYLLTKRLARGGTCDVYQARDLVALGVAGDQSFLALKVLRDDVVEAVGDAGLVLNEALLTRKLNHPSIIKIFDYHCDQEGATDRHFVTMELVEGETLADLLARTPGRQLGYWHAMAILVPVASALQAAHEKGVIHSDIKPGNILIGHDGQVKVIDFGTARGLMHALKRKPWRKGRQTDHHAQDTERVRSYLAFTHEYASQEVINDEPPAPEDDVYALACVLFETLSGRKQRAAVPGESLSDAAELKGPSETVESDAVDNVAVLNGNLNAGFLQSLVASSASRRPSALNFAQWRVLKKGLSAQKRHRYHSVAEFIDAFKRARSRPKKALMALVILPLIVFAIVEGQQRYAAHRATIETWAQSDLQLVQATQYADVLSQTPVQSLPRVLADLTGLPALLQAGVLATSAEQTLVQLGDYVNDRLAYNALALSELGVKVNQPGAALKHLQRANAEFLDYESLLGLLDTVGRYFPDSVRLTAIQEQVGKAQEQELTALHARWLRLWDGNFTVADIEGLMDIHRRVVSLSGVEAGPKETTNVNVNSRSFDLPEGALDRYQKATNSAANGTDAEHVKVLRQLASVFGERHPASEAMAAVWAPFDKLAKDKAAYRKALAEKSRSTNQPASIETKAEQQAVIAIQLLFVANVWRDVDLLSAPDKLKAALETVDLDLQSSAAAALVSALIERIELKISYYNNTDRTVSTRRLEALRDQLARL